MVRTLKEKPVPSSQSTAATFWALTAVVAEAIATRETVAGVRGEAFRIASTPPPSTLHLG